MHESGEETPEVETSEGLKATLKQTAETEGVKLLEGLRGVVEGELKGLEEPWESASGGYQGHSGDFRGF
ncbi:MAG: hypothetical protein NVSMB27_28990 [Ktedonobacteraceae bacterium]